MSKEAREFKKIRRHTITQINAEFNEFAKKFIAHIFQLDKKHIPEFAKLSNNEILQIYSEAQNELLHKLMLHRHNPITDEYIDELRYMNSIGMLPKSTKIVLESFSC